MPCIPSFPVRHNFSRTNSSYSTSLLSFFQTPRLSGISSAACGLWQQSSRVRKIMAPSRKVKTRNESLPKIETCLNSIKVSVIPAATRIEGEQSCTKNNVQIITGMVRKRSTCFFFNFSKKFGTVFNRRREDFCKLHYLSLAFVFDHHHEDVHAYVPTIKARTDAIVRLPPKQKGNPKTPLKMAILTARAYLYGEKTVAIDAVKFQHRHFSTTDVCPT